MSEPTMTQSDPRLGEGFASRDIATVRFDTALRGYRMDQVDAVLDQLQDRIAELEARAAPDVAATHDASRDASRDASHDATHDASETHQAGATHGDPGGTAP